jgi:hypothetical protein
MEVSTKQFTFKDNEFITEVSNLTRDSNPFHRIYSDSCDEGLILISEKTGQSSTWYVSRYEYTNDEDYEFVAWHLLPTMQTVRKFPQLKNTTMVIFND